LEKIPRDPKNTGFSFLANTHEKRPLSFETLAAHEVAVDDVALATAIPVGDASGCFACGLLPPMKLARLLISRDPRRNGPKGSGPTDVVGATVLMRNTRVATSYDKNDNQTNFARVRTNETRHEGNSLTRVLSCEGWGYSVEYFRLFTYSARLHPPRRHGHG